MNVARSTDFTEGSIPRHLIQFAIPMFLGNILQALYNTVDSIWVGRFLGPDALGAVSVGFPIIMALISIVMGITMAATVLVSQYFGAQRPDMVRRTVGNTLTLLVVSGLILSVAGVLLAPVLLKLINTPEALMDMAVSYLRIFLSGLVFMFLYNAAGAILRGLGDSRTPLVFLFYSTVINIILDPLLILGIGPFPRMEVAGAALATVIAQAVSCILLLRHLGVVNRLLPGSFGEWRVDGDLTAKTFRIGLPAGAQQLLVSLGGLFLTSIINTFGTVVVAAYGAAARLDQFAFMPSMSVGLATSTLTGQNLGAGKEERVKEVVRWGVLLTGGITSLATIFALVAPQALLGLFTTDREVLNAGSAYLRIVGISYLPFAVMFAINGVLRGAGDTLPTMLTTLAALWLVRVPLAKILSGIPALGINGVWIGIAVSPLVGMTISYLYYRTGRWKTKAVIRRRQGPADEEVRPEDVMVDGDQL